MSPETDNSSSLSRSDVPPPHDAPPAVNPHPQCQRGEASFDFGILGPRVPAVVVSPRIEKHILLNDGDYEASMALPMIFP